MSRKRSRSAAKTDTSDEVQIPRADGAILSTAIPPYHLITESLMRRLAYRCALGIEKKGDKAWNAISNNQQVLTDIELIYERIGHVIKHAYALRDKLRRYDKGNYHVFSEDDDAGAIAWGAMFLCSAVDALAPKSD